MKTKTWSLLTLLAIAAGSAHATTLEPWTQAEIINQADIVFVGRVEWVAPSTDPIENTIHETVGITVVEAIKPLTGTNWPRRGDVVKITKMGGTQGSRKTIVSGMPQMPVGELGIAVIDYSHDGSFPLTLMGRGWTPIHGGITHPDNHSPEKPRPARAVVAQLRRISSVEARKAEGEEAFLEGREIPKDPAGKAAARKAAREYLKELGESGKELEKAARELKRRGLGRESAREVLEKACEHTEKYPFLEGVPDFPDPQAVEAALWPCFGGQK